MSSMSKPILTQQYLKKIIYYDPETGWMSWNGSKNWTKRGSIGYINQYGYKVVMIDGKNYSAHRLAWLYIHGEFPPSQLDHINHDRADNRMINLRAVTNQENQMNRKFTGNSSGFRGVYWDKARKKWAPKIKYNQVIINLGRFDTLEEAISARLSAEADYGFHANHGIILTD